MPPSASSQSPDPTPSSPRPRWLRWLLRLPDIPATPSIRYAVGGLAVASGLGLAAWSAGAFRRRKTAVQPWKASTALVIEGPYGFSRNPIYVGFALTYAGLAIAMDSALALFLLFALPGWILFRDARAGSKAA